jgi:hypothetical protein
MAYNKLNNNKQTRREMRFLQEREVSFTRTIRVHSPETYKPSSSLSPSPSPSPPPPDLEDWDDWDHLDNRNTNRILNEFTYKTPLELIEEYEPMFTSTTNVNGTGTGTGAGYGKDKDNDKKPEFKFTTRFCPCSDYRYCKRCGPTSG